MKTVSASILILVFLFYRINSQQSFDKFSDKFVTGYTSIHIPDLDLSYVNDFKLVKSADSIQKQLNFFRSIKSGLTSYHAHQLVAFKKKFEKKPKAYLLDRLYIELKTIILYD